VAINGGERLSGTIREKTRFQGFVNTDGTTRPPFQRYFVRLTNQPDREALVDEKHLFRDRKAFTKAMLRSFIKNTVTREAWAGAPWIVKEHIAIKYRIDTTIPPHLTYANHIAEKKANLAQRKDETNNISMMNGMMQTLPELRPKSHKSKQDQALGKNQKLREQALVHGIPSITQSNGGAQFVNNFNHFPAFPPIHKASPISTPPSPKPPAEDLDVPPIRGAPPRPPLKSLSQDTQIGTKGVKAVEGNGILMESVGPLLETWNTLNVYCEVYHLDSFTFDDYVEALQFSSEDVECELFVEIHCALLKQLIEEDGSVAVRLPEIPDDDESNEADSSMNTSAIPTPEPETKPKFKPAGRRTTRSSLAKAEPEPLGPHRAVEMLGDYDWVERLKKNDFRNGGWEVIVVGVLHQLSLNPKKKDMCESLLEKLAPADEEPTRETARLQYQKLDINLRVKILQIICMLTIDTRAVRDYMDECSEQMTQLRKVKIEWQRAKRLA
jgi:DDT domain/WSTF, HB1, Itc1p, MBD9 motif 1